MLFASGQLFRIDESIVPKFGKDTLLKNKAKTELKKMKLMIEELEERKKNIEWT